MSNYSKKEKKLWVIIIQLVYYTKTTLLSNEKGFAIFVQFVGIYITFNG